MIGELHAQIETVQRHMATAERSGLPYEAHLHRARLQDLVHLASRHGIDVTDRVDAALLPSSPPAEA